jgi:ribulose-phosphate 3-epimerase
VPAILTDKTPALADMLQRAEAFTDWVQVDIMDGRFVPSYSIGSHDIAAIKTKLRWEAHIMVQQPEHYLEGFKQAGAQRVIFHYESDESPQQVIEKAKNIGIGIGIALNPETDPDDIEPLLPDLECVLFMAVHPGFYGSKFIPEVLDKIAAFRHKHPDIEIGVDGGIKADNIVQVAQSGVDSICVGSAIFLSGNPAENYKQLVALANGASGPL